MPQKHTGEDTYTFFIYLIYKSYTVRLFLRKYFPKPEECVCKALDKTRWIVQSVHFWMLQLCTVYNSFVLPVQCYRVKCRMCTNTLANFVQSYYYTQRKKTKPTKKGEGADSIQAAPSLLFSRYTVFSSRDKKVWRGAEQRCAADPWPWDCRRPGSRPQALSLQEGGKANE